MSETFIGLDHVQLMVPAGEEDTARAFFTGILGMPEIPKPEVLLKNGGLWFQCGTEQLHIGIDSEFKPALKAHPAFRVRNIEALRETVQAKGLKIIEDTPIPGCQRFFLTDPFGNRLEFVARDGTAK